MKNGLNSLKKGVVHSNLRKNLNLNKLVYPFFPIKIKFNTIIFTVQPTCIIIIADQIKPEAPLAVYSLY